MESNYSSIRYTNKTPITSCCYLCRKTLEKDITRDHIIPNHFFQIHDPDRPKLFVHKECNISKSKDDEWFVKQVQLRSAYNKEAYSQFSNLMDKAITEKANAYIIGKNVRNYKFVQGIFENVSWGLEFRYEGESYKQLKLPKAHFNRWQKYIETMCQGLFMRNVILSNPNKPKLVLRQYADLALHGKEKGFTETIAELIKDAGASLFGQQWYGRISYMGSRVKESNDKGFIFVDFYNEFCILAYFV